MVHAGNGKVFALNFIYDGADVGDMILYTGEVDEMGMLTWTSSLLPTNADLSFDGTSITSTPQIGFSPDGETGYIYYVGDVTTIGDVSMGNYVSEPVYYYTTDGGATWEGPRTMNLDAFGGFANNFNTIEFEDGSMLENLVPQMDFTHDIIVDADGKMHVGTTVYSSGLDQNDPANTGFTFYPGTGIVGTLVVDGADDSKELYGFTNILSTESMPFSWNADFNNDFRVQMSRNADGDKIFVSYLDSIDAEIASPGTAYRDLWGFAYDINTGLSTEVVNFTGDNADWAGQAFYLTTAPTALQDPLSGEYEMAAVFTEVPADDLSSVYYHYFQNATFTEADFAQEIEVAEYEANLPEGDFVVTPLNSISFDLSVDGAENFDVVIWDFGNGEVDTTFVATNTIFYPSPAEGQEDIYTITVTLYNQDGSVTYTEEVTTTNFVDTEAPVISVQYAGDSVSDGDVITLEANVNTEFFCPDATANDDSGELTDNIIETGCDDVDVTTAGTYVVTYEVTDAAGNATTFTVTFDVQDVSAPTLSTLAGQSTQLIDCNGELPALTSIFAVIDNGAPQLIGDFEVSESGAVDVTVDGTYAVEYTVSDAAGNTSSAQTITYVVSGCDTGIQTVFGGIVSVLPNPTNGQIFVDLSETSVRSAVISIFDVQGRLLTEVEADNTAAAINIDLSTYADGIYMVHINAGEFGVAVDRIILAK